jgi:hypothetical protein
LILACVGKKCKKKMKGKTVNKLKKLTHSEQYLLGVNNSSTQVKLIHLLTWLNNRTPIHNEEIFFRCYIDDLDAIFLVVDYMEEETDKEYYDRIKKEQELLESEEKQQLKNLIAKYGIPTEVIKGGF